MDLHWFQSHMSPLTDTGNVLPMGINAVLIPSAEPGLKSNKLVVPIVNWPLYCKVKQFIVVLVAVTPFGTA